MSRIVIAGGPRTGKTTMAEDIRRCCPTPDRVRHTDDLLSYDWAEASRMVSEWFNEPGPWIIEGVTVSRALRKWRQQHPGEPPPIDRCIFLTKPFEELTAGQAAMSWGVATVHAEIALWLQGHGIRG